MGRRRLQTILATTIATAGLSAAPAWAGVGDLTDTLEDTVTTVTEEVETVTGDGTLDVDLDVDAAPSDEDGSPQLEIDGGVTIADQQVDLGSATDPVEDAVDPDPSPAPSPSPGTDGSDTQTDTSGTSTTPEGATASDDGVVAASTDARPLDLAPWDSPLGQAIAAHGALDRGGFGVTRYGNGTTTSVDRVPAPEVAPRDTPVASPQFVVPDGEAETPAVLATGLAPEPGGEGPIPGLLRVLAAAMVLGTAAVWTRAIRQA